MAKDDIGGVWRTVGGRRIFIKDGQSLSDAMKESGKFGGKEQNYNNLSENLTKEDIKVLDYYVMDAGAYDINYVLRNEESIPTENDKRAIADMEKAINKSSLKDDVEVYRYISNENVFKDIKVGETYVDKGFMSTTYEKNTDREDNFQDYKIKAVIKAHKGDSALDVSNIYDKQTENPESEIIFNKNTKLILKEIKNEKDKYDEFTRKVYYFETKQTENKTKNNYMSMNRKDLVTLLVEDQIKRGIINKSSKEIQIQKRMNGSLKMNKKALIEYAEKYL